MTALFYGSKKERQQESRGRDAPSACSQSERRLRPQRKARRVATSIHRLFSLFFQPLTAQFIVARQQSGFHGLLSSITTWAAFVPRCRHLGLFDTDSQPQVLHRRFWPDLRDAIHTYMPIIADSSFCDLKLGRDPIHGRRRTVCLIFLLRSQGPHLMIIPGTSRFAPHPIRSDPIQLPGRVKPSTWTRMKIASRAGQSKAKAQTRTEQSERACTARQSKVAKHACIRNLSPLFPFLSVFFSSFLTPR